MKIAPQRTSSLPLAYANLQVCSTFLSRIELKCSFLSGVTFWFFLNIQIYALLFVKMGVVFDSQQKNFAFFPNFPFDYYTLYPILTLLLFLQQLQYESKVGDINKDDEDSGSSSSKKGHPSASENNDGRGSTESGENSSSRRDSASGEETSNGQSAAAQSTNDEKKEKSAGGDGGEMSVLLLKGAQIVNDDAVFEADVWIQNGIIL